MSEKINLNQLGVIYTILNKDTEEVSKVRVIDSRDIYRLTKNVRVTDENFAAELKQVVKGMMGFSKSPYHITWYAATQDNYKVENAVAAAKREGNKVVVIELLPDLELDTGYNLA